MKYKNIAISGDIGSGKSTLADNLAKKLGWKALHAGEFFRRWHQEHNIPLNHSELIPEELDRKIENSFQEKMRSSTNYIFESHLSGWLAKDYKSVFKVLCTATDEVKMARAAKRDGVSIEDATKNAHERSKSYSKKFEKLYGVKNHLDKNYFDLIVDTTELTPEEVMGVVLEKLEKNYL